MGFNSTTGSEAGKISKRGKSLNIDLRNDLKTLITHILKDLDYKTLSNTQKLRLLDIALKHSLPKLSIEQHITELREQDMLNINYIYFFIYTNKIITKKAIGYDQ